MKGFKLTHLSNYPLLFSVLFVSSRHHIKCQAAFRHLIVIQQLDEVIAKHNWSKCQLNYFKLHLSKCLPLHFLLLHELKLIPAEVWLICRNHIRAVLISFRHTLGGLYLCFVLWGGWAEGRFPSQWGVCPVVGHVCWGYQAVSTVKSSKRSFLI